MFYGIKPCRATLYSYSLASLVYKSNKFIYYYFKVSNFSFLTDDVNIKEIKERKKNNIAKPKTKLIINLSMVNISTLLYKV